MEIRALVLGDGKVGKTSFIHSLISEELEGTLPRIHSPIKIPSDQCIEGCSVTIIDSYCEKPCKLNKDTKAELTKCNVVLLVYDISMSNTIDNITNFWIPYINKHSTAPVILLGNKLDLKSQNKSYSLDHLIVSLRKTNISVEFIIECSSITMENLDYVFLQIQKSALFPISPLYDTRKELLSSGFVNALKMIFHRFDKDQDCLLSPQELIDIQAEAFQIEITESQAQDLINMISVIPGNTKVNSVTFQGFMYLQELLIKQLKQDVCWKLLMRFNFGYSLKLNINFDPPCDPHRLRLSNTAISFLISIFDKHSVSNKLNTSAARNIFLDSWPISNKKDLWAAFKDTVKVTEENISSTSWLSLWHLLVYLDYESSLRCILMMGCDLSAEKIFIEADSASLTIVCLLGINQAGKSWISNQLISKDQISYEPTSSIKYACNAVYEDPVPWLSKYLLLIEYPVIEIDKLQKFVGSVDTVAVVLNEEKASADFINDIHKILGMQIKAIDNTRKRLDRQEVNSILLKTFWPSNVNQSDILNLTTEHSQLYKYWIIGILAILIAIILKTLF